MYELTRSELQEALELTNALVAASTANTNIKGGLCFHYTAMGIQALAVLGHKGRVEAGSANWLTCPSKQEWFGFAWNGEDNEERILADGHTLDLALPEVHCWIRMDTGHILDFSMQDMKKTLGFFGLEWGWEKDPFPYIYTRNPSSLYYSYYPFDDATDMIERKIGFREAFIEQRLQTPQASTLE